MEDEDFTTSIAMLVFSYSLHSRSCLDSCSRSLGLTVGNLEGAVPAIRSVYGGTWQQLYPGGLVHVLFWD